MKITPLNRVTLSVLLAALASFTPNLQAGWGSLQGNNHAAPQQNRAPAPRPPSQPFHAAEPSRTPEPNRAPEPIRPAQPIERTPDRAPDVRPEPRPEANPGRDQPGRFDQGRPQPGAAYRTPAAEIDRRRMDIGDERRQSFFWSDYQAGMRIDHLPDGYRRFGLRGHDYYFFGGVFYDTGPAGYVVVAPPLDADVPELPPGVETVQDASGNIFYYAGGAFYIQQGGGYVVVAPPMGVTVSELPPNAVATVFNGLTYYQVYGVWYQPVMQNGVTVYLTIPQPQ